MLVSLPLGATPNFSHIACQFSFEPVLEMHLLHMTNDFNKSRGEGFCLGKESDRHSMLLMRDFNLASQI
jgi:hypothetical protein